MDQVILLLVTQSRSGLELNACNVMHSVTYAWFCVKSCNAHSAALQVHCMHKLLLSHLLPKGFTRCLAQAIRAKVIMLKLLASKFCQTGKPCCFSVLAHINIVARKTELSAYKPRPNTALSE